MQTQGRDTTPSGSVSATPGTTAASKKRLSDLVAAASTEAPSKVDPRAAAVVAPRISFDDVDDLPGRSNTRRLAVCVLAGALVFGVVAAFASSVAGARQETFTATAKFLIFPLPFDRNNPANAAQIAAEASQLSNLSGGYVQATLAETVEARALVTPPEGANVRYSVRTVPQTSVVAIEATSPDRELVEQLVSQSVERASQEITVLNTPYKFNLLDNGIGSATPSGTDPSRLRLAGLVGGFLLALAVGRGLWSVLGAWRPARHATE
jgi:hypothetical protein